MIESPAPMKNNIWYLYLVVAALWIWRAAAVGASKNADKIGVAFRSCAPTITDIPVYRYRYIQITFDCRIFSFVSTNVTEVSHIK